MDFLKEAQDITNWTVNIRRDLHMHPEHGNKEFFTSEYICNVLRSLGLEPVRYLETAVIADLHGALPGPMVAFRADMDALPIQEETGLPYASKIPGMMHACGHDMHVASALAAAKILVSHKDELPGTVRFLFQPDEEMDGGAKRMVEAGCLDGVNQVFGAHVRSDIPAGYAGVRYGVSYAASNPFKITIHGKSAHGAEPQDGADAIMAGAQIVTALQTIVSRRMAPIDPAVITVGSFHAGSQCNIIADKAVLEGTMRTFGEENRHKLVSLMENMVQNIAAAMGVTAETDITWGYPGVVNDHSSTELVQRSAEELFGVDHVKVYAEPLVTTEDFGYFLQNAPGSFYHIGVGKSAPMHSGGFMPDEAALTVASALHAKVLWNALGLK